MVDAKDSQASPVADFSPVTPPSRFLARADWIAFWVTVIVALAVYTYTQAPTVTLEDSGEMAVAADYLGVPHPPGYPLWTMLAWSFTRIFSFVKYLGQPNPAWAVGFMSGFFGALTAGLLAMLVSRYGRKYLQSPITANADRIASNPATIPMVAGIVAGLAAAFAPVQWSQSVIVEVYTMNAFLVVIQLLVAGKWVENPSNKLLFILVFLFGISFTHYFYASAVNLSILVIVIYIRDRRLFWDATGSGLSAISIYMLLSKAFPDQGYRLFKFLLGASRAFDSGMPESEALAILQKRYLYSLGGAACLAVAIAAIAGIHYAFARRMRVEAFIFKCVVGTVMTLVAIPLFIKAFQLGSKVPEALLQQKTQMFLSGATVIIVPIVLWILQSQLMPKLQRRYTVVVIPLVLLTCILVGGRHFIASVALGRTPQPGQPLHVFLNLEPASKAILQAAILFVTAAVVWIWQKRALRDWKRIIPMGLLILGVWILVHLYLPWASDRNPPMNWGYPRTLEGFKHAVLRGQYQALDPIKPLTGAGIRYVGHYFYMLYRQFTLPIALLGLIPFACWSISFGKWRLRGSVVCFLMALLALPFYVPSRILENFAGKEISAGPAAVYTLLAVVIILCALGGLVALAFEKNEIIDEVFGRIVRWLWAKMNTTWVFYTLLFVLGALLVIVPLKSVTQEGIRKYFALANYARVTDAHAIYWSEIRVLLIYYTRVIVLLASGVAFLAASVVLLGWFARWLWAQKLRSETVIYISLGALGAIGLLVLLFFRAPLSMDKVFTLLKNPGATANLVGAWKDAEGDKKIFEMGGLPLLLAYVPLICYSLCSLFIALRHWVSTAYYQPGETVDPISACWDIPKEVRHWLVVGFWTFISWGLIFAIMAHIKPTIQDTFIQRVKFLTSYGIFSLWIGYGLIIVATHVLPDLFPKTPAVARTACFCVMLGLPLIPILNNAYNRTIIDNVGACDLNGHDFGWQFGNYQLRGAEAILEELSDTEEPLPNPTYPEEMGQGAIFYGGTDPGRFVPTYMIFSGKVREDVFLITQNALADGTYMSVMRDLYGNDIWIPSQPDSAIAFDRYVKEVNAGTRRPNAAITIANGRVSVSGALGVMEINGILAQMIFEHNNYRHDFYVEESYVIPWMYPYLLPHGLIMKINKTRAPLTDRIANDDQDFWDWYTRRLVGNPKFQRDVSARKSFSKLRSAIAGSYSSRGISHMSRRQSADAAKRMRQARQAFEQARILYDLSPEASFRLAQEVFMRQQRWDDARRVIAQLAEGDPHNDRTLDFLSKLDRIKYVQNRISEMERQMPQGRVNLANALEILDLYRESGNFGKLQALANSILKDPKVSIDVTYRVALILQKAGRKADVVKALDTCVAKLSPQTPLQALLDIRQLYLWAQNVSQAVLVMQEYVKRQPNDWRGWLDLSSMTLMGMRQTNAAIFAAQQALKHGGKEAAAMINADRRFAPIRSRLGAPTSRAPAPGSRPPVNRQPWQVPGVPGRGSPPNSTGR